MTFRSSSHHTKSRKLDRSKSRTRKNGHTRPITFEPLEDRRLLSVTAEIIKDINLGTPPSQPDGFVQFNNHLYFSADDGIRGRELWKTDGTSSGTTLVKDIKVGALGSSPTEFVEINGSLFFTAIDNVNGRELWKTDGTDAGTVMVKDISPGPNTPTSPLDGAPDFPGTVNQCERHAILYGQ